MKKDPSLRGMTRERVPSRFDSERILLNSAGEEWKN